MKSKLIVIKIGGNIINKEKDLQNFLSDLTKKEEPIILVHGGGNLATQMSDQLGIQTQMIDGRRITSKENLEIVTMIYAGLINKKITAALQGFGKNAVGLSGADGNCIASNKRSTNPIDYGFVGDIKQVNGKMIQVFLENKMLPVFCAITHDEAGQLLNTNADTIAAEIAIAMSAFYETELIYCFEKKGVLSDSENEDSVISKINKADYQQLQKDGTIHSGMLPKMKNCFHALDNNVSTVLIGNTEIINNSQTTFTTITL